METTKYFTGKILVVDDEITVRVLLTKILENAGNEVFSTGIPEEATDLVDALDVDALLLDVNMPNVNGIEVCENIRKTRPNLPIIMLTGMTDRTTCQRTITSGANDFITKPIDAGEVLIRVKNAIQMRRLQISLASQKHQFDEMMNAVSKLGHDVEDLSLTNTSTEKKVRVEDVLSDYMLDEFNLDEEEDDFLVDASLSDDLA